MFLKKRIIQRGWDNLQRGGEVPRRWGRTRARKSDGTEGTTVKDPLARDHDVSGTGSGYVAGAPFEVVGREDE